MITRICLNTYLWGPCIRIGIRSYFNKFNDASPLWYAAPSIVHNVFALQPGLSLSSFKTRDFQNKDIMLSFEFDYDNAIYRFPNVSIAVNIVTLGVTWKALTELFESGACHFLRRQSLIPSHVSSRLSNTLSTGFYFSKVIAHCYLKTKLLSELALIAIWLTFLNFSPISVMVFLISVSLIFRLDPKSFDRELDTLFSLILFDTY